MHAVQSEPGENKKPAITKLIPQKLPKRSELFGKGRQILVYGRTPTPNLEKWEADEIKVANERLRRQRAAGRPEFADMPELPVLTNLGMTVSKQHHYMYDQGAFSVVTTHADEPCAPQQFQGGEATRDIYYNIHQPRLPQVPHEAPSEPIAATSSSKN